MYISVIPHRLSFLYNFTLSLQTGNVDASVEYFTTGMRKKEYRDE